MKHKSRLFYVCILGLTIILLFLQSGVYANGNKVYVAGKDSFYPVEYYSEKTRQYEGVMPEVLKTISIRTGISFVYVGNGKSQNELMENLQAEIISAQVIGRSNDDSRIIPVFSFKQDGQTIKIGLEFTEAADDKLINAVREGLETISQEEINGYIISASEENRHKSYMWHIIIGIVILLAFAYVIRKTRKKFQKALSADKMTDFDTGIGNLLYFENSFNKVITNENRSLYYLVYIFIDSNYLQMYHGEVVLKDAIRFTANTLAEYTGDKTFAAKISESGFAIAFPSVNEQNAKSTVLNIINKLNLYIEKTEYHERQYYTAAVYNLKQSDKNIEILLYNLRIRCSELMNTESQVIYCDNSMMQSISQEKELLENIIYGFDNNEFKLFVQFIVNNKTKKIVSAEALSRWESSKMGLISPGKYLEAMERSGYIVRLDYYMFETCCRQLHKWNGTEFDGLTLSCNITRTTLSEVDFIQKIKEISEKYVFNKEKLFIEITEETIEKSFDRATENVKACKKLGYGVSLDDMGTGYTSLINLCDYPIDIVKIDREILLKTDTENGKGLFTGMVSLVHSLGMKVICEGVETDEQNKLVEETDCDMVQGFYYSHTFPIREGEEFAKEYIQRTEKQISPEW